MRARDGIVGSGLITGQAPGTPVLDQGERLARLSADYRSTVVLTELLEDMAFESASDTGSPVAHTARWQRRATAGDLMPLAEFIAPKPEDFRRAIPLVGGYADLRDDRMAEILAQTTDLMPFFTAILPLEPERSRRIGDMLSIALDLSDCAVMRVKLALGCPRPNQFSNRIQPVINTPAHAAFPSGHATQAFLLATLLTLLDDPGATLAADSQLFRMASRIAANRTVAGVHYPADSAAGAMLGMTLARYLVARAVSAGQAGGVRMDGTRWVQGNQPRDFHLGEFAQMLTGDDPAAEFTAASPVRPAPLWGWLWAQARKDWTNRWS
ncbi:MAG: phosphatase PAP2 family protein [Paracoccus sp. (in: a-proteobacteria)]|uniref:phosphatase PAP2 family protein n=1 Tax=Paracoccus sp. TaxID=267 RepID=UPI0026DFBDB9|nr:phosphatase PAP2 family protein [Paracoccus sp. (in: a-proteobacteria)]MDO5631923.1 phosphatase PAP2 family protein [Paracoccus sp. (in: a-proteobacteria)]